MLSIGAKVKQIAGLAGTSAVDKKTDEFIRHMDRATDNGRRTSHLSEKQVEWIEDIHSKHFGSAQ